MRRYQDVTPAVRQGHLDTPGEWPVYGTALTEAVHIPTEIKHTSVRTVET